MSEEQGDSIRSFLQEILDEMVASEASDMYLTVGSPPGLRIGDHIEPFESPPLSADALDKITQSVLDEMQYSEFESTLELNIAYTWNDKIRFRMNFFKQQHHTGIVIRRVKSEIPTIEKLGLSPVFASLALKRRGLVLIASPSGSGKSTSLASMLQHRNHHGYGHVLTIEDPIEYIHEHRNCIFTQREIGIDTYSYSMALKNAFRQRADVVVIGEIRDRETMEHAINFSETGHLCIATLHANNASQAIERIINFFPEEYHHHYYVALSQNIEAIISQKLIANTYNSQSMVAEIMVNQGIIRTLISDARIIEIKEHMDKLATEGCMTFEKALLTLYNAGTISEEVAMNESENPNRMKLLLREQKPAQQTTQHSTLNASSFSSGSLNSDF